MLLVRWQEGHLACKKQRLGTGMVICLGRGADLRMAQLMPLPLTISCSSKSTGCPIKNDPQICFCNNYGKCTPILILFSLLQQENYGAQNLLFQPPHLYYVATLPSETNTDAVSM